jgi:hypothetical protein
VNEGVLLLFCSYKPFRAQFAAGDFAKNEKRKTFPLLPCSDWIVLKLLVPSLRRGGRVPTVFRSAKPAKKPNFRFFQTTYH